ncbi:amidase [Nocardia sp. BMG51109]|uniref:amidase n=1 Tax=Nocardia sp. BMG51109 TaxID=1056816 RepID=UPI000466B781|nr:amidase [Nocardia sp. BMG51109]
MTTHRVHAFRDDALAEHDAVALAQLIRTRDVSPEELAAAAAERVAAVEPCVRAIECSYDTPRFAADGLGCWYGVPTFVKDNTDIRGLPTTHGSAAFRAHTVDRDDAYTRQFLSTGVTVLGKSRLPEFGLIPTTEFRDADPARNPWNPEYSVGGSSGGAAALVAAGVVPVAHGNDGGGSIRIPASCTGLVALKPSRSRHLDNAQNRHLPIRVISEGVLTRTVRDTATYVAAAEKYWRNPDLIPIGMVDGPAERRMRVALLTTTPTGDEPDTETRVAVERAADLLEKAGHEVEPIAQPFSPQVAEDYIAYFGLLMQVTMLAGKYLHDPSFDRNRVEDITSGLARYYRRRIARMPGGYLRLRQSARTYAGIFRRYQVLLSPVLAQAVPPLGQLGPNGPADELIERLLHYMAYTPVNNVTGTPSIAVPMGLAESGVPLGAMLSAAYGDERTLIELAYLFEEENPFPRITDGAGDPAPPARGSSPRRRPSTRHR